MKKVKIKFEVIVPCFNAESTIERTLDSMINQTYPNWRVWFVNDGSTDKSLDIAYRKSLVDSKIKIFSGSNQGVSAALNYGRAKVLEEGDDNSIVSCCGSDDWYYPQHFEIYAEEFEKYPEMDFLYSDVDCLFPNGEKATPYGIAYHEVFDPSRLQFENPIYAPAAAWKLKCFSVGEFDSRLDSIEDWDFNCRVAKAGYKMIHLKSTLTAVTVRDWRWGSGMAGKRTKEKWELFQRKRMNET